MSIIVMVYGQSGTGKSTSLRNFTPEEIDVVNVSKKPLPFKGARKFNQLDSDDYRSICEFIKKSEKKTIVIDDATYLMTNEFMRNAKVTGFQKYNDLAQNFFVLLEWVKSLPDDRIVYFFGHSEISDDGREKFKTIGKMIDNFITLEGEFTIVLKTVCQDGQYYFQTHNNGQDTVKSPLEMFNEDLVPNDLKRVDAVIREYYEI